MSLIDEYQALPGEPGACVGCGAALMDCAGIGPYCPNGACGRIDDQRPDSQRKEPATIVVRSDGDALALRCEALEESLREMVRYVTTFLRRDNVEPETVDYYTAKARALLTAVERDFPEGA
jgi:hypothetical protein